MRRSELLQRLEKYRGSEMTVVQMEQLIHQCHNYIENNPNLIEDIEDFHNKYGIAPESENIDFLSDDHMHFRLNFHEEEVDETRKAYNERKLDDHFDGIVDSIYVLLGTAYLQNLPFRKGWQTVHSKNMEKVRVDRPENSTRGSGFDVIKPPGWTPPDMQAVIDTERMLRAR